MTSEQINGVFGWRITKLEKTVEDLQTKVDRMTWALVIAALSFSGSVAIFAITITTQ